MTSLANQRITIVGLGLMGGSLAMALRPHVGHITAVDQHRPTLQEALAQGVVDAATDRLAVGVGTADLVILATPVRVILGQLGELAGLRPEGCMVVDLGSTKQAICQAMAALPEGFQAVGGHPMCGRETSGLGAATADLYRDKTFILCRTERTTAAVEQVALELVTAVGARPLWLAAEEHDGMVAAVSHLPYLVAAGLMQQVAGLAERDERFWQVSASGFRDTSRLAGSNPAVMGDILLTNRAAVLAVLADYQERLKEVEEVLQVGDEAALLRWLRQSGVDYQAYKTVSSKR